MRGTKKEFGLNCIVTTRFSEKIQNTRNFRREIYQKLETLINEQFGDNELDWIGCNSLGAEDMVFVILADDINTFAKFVSLLKQAKIKGRYQITEDEKNDNELFLAISSFVGFNIDNWSENPKADLVVRVTCKSVEKENRVIEKLMQEGIKQENIQRMLLGKCILDVRIPTSDSLLKYFHTNVGMFNGKSEFYQQNILSSRSYWIVNPEVVNSFCMSIEDEISIEEKTISNYSDTVNQIPLVQFILKEYEKMIKSRNTVAWKEILSRQYEIVRKLIEEYSEGQDIEMLYSLLRHTQNVLLHIRQATTPIAQVPYHNYTYSGSYNDILRMYYGVIASLVELGYQMPHDKSTIAYEIEFCVDFEMTSKIHSTMYYSKDSSYNKRFVVFHLPFEAFTDVKRIVTYLVHEVFHYIAPYCREKRNIILLEMWSISIILRLVNTLNTEFGVNHHECETILIEFSKKGFMKNEIIQKAKEVMPDFEKRIINDFILDRGTSYCFSKLAKEILLIFVMELCNNEEVCSSICEKVDEINEKQNLTLKQKTIYAVLNKMENDIFYNYVRLDMKWNAQAVKEAFCDINMVKVMKMSLLDYLRILYDLLVKEKLIVNNGTFDDFQYDRRGIRLGQFERRIGILFDIFCTSEDKSNAYENFKKELKKLDKEKESNDFIEFTNYCSGLYRTYLEKYNHLKRKYKELYTETFSFWEGVENEEYQKDIRKVLEINDSIDKNIDFISTFIEKGNSLFIKKNRKMNTQLQDSFKKSSIIHFELDNDRRPFVRTLGEYVDEVNAVIRKMGMNIADFTNSCWYRGVCSADFKMIPSLHRKYKKSEKWCPNLSPYAYQAKLLKEAYFDTMSFPDLWTEQMRGIVEQTCFLQHYGKPTSLLDFSLDMLVALYFSLNPDVPEDYNNVTIGQFQPKVVIFNPLIYSKAICSLREGFINSNDGLDQFSPVIFDICDKGMESYFVSDMSAEYALKDTKSFFAGNYIPDRRIDKYPKPLIVRQSNSRVLSQNGIFLAFDLCAEWNGNEGDFLYLSLDEIQKSYLELAEIEKNRNVKQFMEEILIDPICVDRLRKELELMGITKSKYYPEFDKVIGNNKC